MNRLKIEKQEAIIAALVEGASIRSIERMTGVHRDTIMRLGVRVGQGCARMLDEQVRDLDCRNIQVDEIWSYIGKKERQVQHGDNRAEVGDCWVWVALDADTKLVPSFVVGKRTVETAKFFLSDLSSRLQNRIQLSSDGLGHYVAAVEEAFGCDVDYGQIVKSYEAEEISPGRYSPPQVVAVEKHRITGHPDRDKVSTSYVERQNLTMRMCMRRFTRLTNAFSKKLENHKAAVALHFAYYNFARKHKTLGMTPAMAAGLECKQWSVRDLVECQLS